MSYSYRLEQIWPNGINGIPNGCPNVFRFFCPRYPGSGELGRQRPRRSREGNQHRADSTIQNEATRTLAPWSWNRKGWAAPSPGRCPQEKWNKSERCEAKRKAETSWNIWNIYSWTLHCNSGGWADQRLSTLGSRSWQGTELMFQQFNTPRESCQWTDASDANYVNDVRTMFTRCSLSSLLRMPMCAHSWRHWVRAWVLCLLCRGCDGVPNYHSFTTCVV